MDCEGRRTLRELLDMLEEYVRNDYDRLIECEKTNNHNTKELEEELEELLDDINRQV